ncbi:MAG: sulfatase [Planctomycetaceae bacterium]|nr:sulfatase [Planctomycetaceae bacterium]
MNDQELLMRGQRRLFLTRAAGGLGTIALSQLLSHDGLTADVKRRTEPFAPREPHFSPRAKNVIFIFMAGAPSQLDLFDPKPAMEKLHGEAVPASFLEGLSDGLIRGSATVFASPRKFQKFGDCGMEFSDYLPNLSRCADDICMVRSLSTDVANHHPAQLIMNCGSTMWGHPSLGSWVTYGLGSESQNMPGFVVMLSNSGHGVDGGASLWGSGFLPSIYRGVTFRSRGDAILHLTNPPGVRRSTQRLRLDVLRDLNQLRFQRTGDREIASRIANYEMGFRMQDAAPEILDFSRETTTTRTLYGLDHERTRWFGSNCLSARRLIERGVRFVQLYHTTWDDHSNLNTGLKTNCEMTDLPAAGLIQDLKQRGLLEDTLIIWGGEFGRTPMNEVRRGNSRGREGRDHHPFAFTTLLCGGGIKRGQVVGATDEIGYHVIRDPIHVHDLQATILHCLGFDHQRLTYRHQGRDFRLTDVGGEVVTQLLA